MLIRILGEKENQKKTKEIKLIYIIKKTVREKDLRNEPELEETQVQWRAFVTMR